MMPNRFDRGAAPEATDKRSPNALVGDHLFASRTVLVFGEIHSTLAESVTAQLLALAARGREPIRMLINSQGGHVESADTIHDVVRFVEPEVRIVATGWCA
ncbi:MAG TPA: ATP-dependent Clp protease proteolytic subunit, partial [Polyangiaceae bacterium]|nr:ATP-dependent Clp protease proteolytic subunit [Polyangiaceae bacterium]